MTPIPSPSRAQQKTYYFAPLGTVSEKTGGERNLVRGMFFHAKSEEEARQIVEEHNKYDELRKVLARKTLKDKDPNSPQQKRNDDVVDYFNRRKPGSYAVFDMHGNLDYDPIHTTLPAGWKQVPNPKGRAISGEFTPYAEENLKMQEELMLTKMKLDAKAKDFETYEKKDGHIVVLDKATPINKKNQAQGHLLQVRITEPRAGKNFGTPAVYFVHKDDMPGFNPDAHKPGTILEIPDTALKIRTNTDRLTKSDRELIQDYLRTRNALPTAK